MITERRLSRRFPAHVGIVSSDEEGLNFSFINSLSREGAYVETEKILAVGTTFRFVLSNRMTQAPMESRVIRTRDAFFDGGKSGFAVRFENLDHMAKVVRDDLLLYLMNLRYHNMWEAA